MVNWKTSLFGVLAFIALNLDEVGVNPKIAKFIASAFIAGGFTVAKDRDVTGVGLMAHRPDDLTKNNSLK